MHEACTCQFRKINDTIVFSVEVHYQRDTANKLVEALHVFIKVDINGHDLLGNALQQSVKKSPQAAKCSSALSLADMEVRYNKQSCKCFIMMGTVDGYLETAKNHINPWKHVYHSLILELCRYRRIKLSIRYHEKTVPKISNTQSCL